jgi:hypothetical protein
VDNGTDEVIFSVSAALQPWRLVEPQDPFQACSLFREARFVDSHDLDLVRIWAMMMPSNLRCKPQLVTVGLIGSGKTRMLSGLAELFGITCRTMKVEDGGAGEGDFWTAINAGGLTIVDNVDKHIRWLADNLASASTGGTRDKRRLYTDSMVEQQRARAWIGVTSANPTFAADSGSADRFLVVRMDRREHTVSEEKLGAELAGARDAGISFIAEAWSKALADTAPVLENLNKRHPEFAEKAVRLGRAIGREAEVKDALQKAERDKARLNLENSDLGAALLAVITPESPFCGSAKDLLIRLACAGFCTEHFWSPKKVGKLLQAQSPHLMEVFQFSQNRGHAGGVTYSIAKKTVTPSAILPKLEPSARQETMQERISRVQAKYLKPQPAETVAAEAGEARW